LIEVRITEEGLGIPTGVVPSSVVGIRKGDLLFLHPLETLYLVLEGEAKVLIDDEEIKDFKEALSRIIEIVKTWCIKERKGCYLANAFWSMFTTYYKLRRKGRKVLPEGRREGTLIEIRKNKWWAEYLVLEEGIKISIAQLLEWVEEVRANDLKAIIAVVDRNGSVTFYEASRVTLRAPDKRSEGGRVASTAP